MGRYKVMVVLGCVWARSADSLQWLHVRCVKRRP
eukprot:COSAG03_NODE_11702_length_579_cov_7639.685417_1_plen_33_part_10